MAVDRSRGVHGSGPSRIPITWWTITPTLLIIFIIGMFLFGMMVSFASVPDNVASAINSFQSGLADTRSLKERMNEWTGTTSSSLSSSTINAAVGFPEYPDWSVEHWTPISVSGDPRKGITVELCKLNHKAYFEAPHLYPMFKDLVKLSDCYGSNKRTGMLHELLQEARTSAKMKVMTPSGFVFHESRVGSTLAANLLGSDPLSLVFSESGPPTYAITGCSSCSQDERVALFRDIVTLMSSSPIHTRVFFKFQSIMTTGINTILKAFPDTPWMFLYRHPVQTMMSHLDPKKRPPGAMAVCLKSKTRTSPKVADTIRLYKEHYGSVTDDVWCAAHLKMLCDYAIDAMSTHGKFIGGARSGVQRGLAVDYDSMPGVVARQVLRHFGVQDVNDAWLAKMAEESGFYSKSRQGATKSLEFSGDSEDKENRAPKGLRSAAEKLLGDSFSSLTKLSTESLLAVGLSEDVKVALREDPEKAWVLLSELPTSSAQNSMSSAAGSSKVAAAARNLELISFASTHNSQPFEKVSCPDEPEPGYPKEYPIMDLLNNWNADETDIPQIHYNSLCYFDYQTEKAKAENYRKAEVPFVVYNVPEVNAVVDKWSDVDYLSNKLKNIKYRSETAADNHFMYFRDPKMRRVKGINGTVVDWKPPTKVVQISFGDWLKVAVTGQNLSLAEREHIYFRVTAADSNGLNSWLFEELSFFRPEPSFFVVKPADQRGIHCRFGMRSIIAECHYDGSRNFVAGLGGMRRWILSHPKNCQGMYLLPKAHPSGRHSDVDWSKPDLDTYPNFVNVRANEMILRPGDVLYVPTSWFHYIVSLNVNYQCNTRSGRTLEYSPDLQKCGFQ